MLNVLIVSSLQESLDGMSHVVKMPGRRVYTAVNAEKAMDIIKTNHIDVLICDDDLQDIPGFVFIALVRQDFPLIISILIVPGPALDTLGFAVNEGNIFKYLIKPVSDDDLLRSINEAGTMLDAICRYGASEKAAGKGKTFTDPETVNTESTDNERFRIMVADDSKSVRSFLKLCIKDIIDAEVLECEDGEEALKCYADFNPDIILLDVIMPKFDGIEVLRQIREKDREVIIVIVTATHTSDLKYTALNTGATEFLHKPVDKNELMARLSSLIELRKARNLINNKAMLLKEQVGIATKTIRDREFETLMLLAEVAEINDEITGEHVVRVGTVAKKLALELGQGDEYADLIYYAAPLHDIGKLSIDSAILKKNAKLTREEFEQMTRHTEIGHEILKNTRSPYTKLGAEIAISHHEKYDGSGYPFGLKGGGIPLSGRIVALADVYDALVHERPYKKKWKVEDAVHFILGEKGKHFDPAVVDAFQSSLSDII